MKNSRLNIFLHKHLPLNINHIEDRLYLWKPSFYLLLQSNITYPFLTKWLCLVLESRYLLKVLKI